VDSWCLSCPLANSRGGLKNSIQNCSIHGNTGRACNINCARHGGAERLNIPCATRCHWLPQEPEPGVRVVEAENPSIFDKVEYVYTRYAQFVTTSNDFRIGIIMSHEPSALGKNRPFVLTKSDLH
jgi:hypothetical protein